MRAIYEHRKVAKSLAAAPIEVQKRYEKWKDVVAISGPQGLKQVRGFHDEALSGQGRGYRSSRLNKQYRVIYRVEKQKVFVEVQKITPQDYGRK